MKVLSIVNSLRYTTRFTSPAIRVKSFDRMKIDVKKMEEVVEEVKEDLGELIKPIFKDRRYGNPWSTWEEKGFVDFIKMRFSEG